MTVSLQLQGTASIGEIPVFNTLSIKIPGGAWTCLLGPSGVGKSTILRLFAGLNSGITFNGKITATDGLPISPRTVMMAQSDLLMPWLDVLGNVTLGARLRGDEPDWEQALALIQRIGLNGLERRKPNALSGGQRQRVALARTMLEDKPVVLLDEPFSALDACSRSAMQEISFELFVGRSVLLVTHDPAEAARLGDQILVLTEKGLQSVEPPPLPAIRPFDESRVLACQGKLLRLIRKDSGCQQLLRLFFQSGWQLQDGMLWLCWLICRALFYQALSLLLKRSGSNDY